MKGSQNEAHAEEEGGEELRLESKVQQAESRCINGGCSNHLELSLGMPVVPPAINYVHQKAGIRILQQHLPAAPPAVAAANLSCQLQLGAAARRWISGGGGAGGFVHPWSLAARQEKAALEQSRGGRVAPANPLLLPPPPPHNPSSPSMHLTPPPLPPPPLVVGWPPVHASRRNLSAGATSKSGAGINSMEVDKATTLEAIDVPKPQPKSRRSAAMFVKVNMEGYAVGRKINLRAHDRYASLSLALQRMFTNFLSEDVIVTLSNGFEAIERDCGGGDGSSFVLLYEDHEGDRMLVGDVPWEMFVTSVKRLYIAHDPTRTTASAAAADR